MDSSDPDTGTATPGSEEGIVSRAANEPLAKISQSSNLRESSFKALVFRAMLSARVISGYLAVKVRI